MRHSAATPQTTNARESVLRLKGDSTFIEAVSVDDLAALLRRTYADGTLERALHRKCDEDPEQAPTSQDNLGRLFARAAVDKAINERDEQTLNQSREMESAATTRTQCDSVNNRDCARKRERSPRGNEIRDNEGVRFTPYSVVRKSIPSGTRFTTK